jgi:hypothetical protein
MPRTSNVAFRPGLPRKLTSRTSPALSQRRPDGWIEASSISRRDGSRTGWGSGRTKRSRCVAVCPAGDCTRSSTMFSPYSSGASPTKAPDSKTSTSSPLMNARFPGSVAAPIRWRWPENVVVSDDGTLTSSRGEDWACASMPMVESRRTARRRAESDRSICAESGKCGKNGKRVSRPVGPAFRRGRR